MRARRSETPSAAPEDRGAQATSPVGVRRVEATLAIAMSVFSLVFVVQSLSPLLSQWEATGSPLGLALVVLVYGWTGVAALAAVLRIWTRGAFLAVAVAYLVALALWQSAIDPPLPSDLSPWLLLLAPMPTGFLIIASRGWRVPLAYAVLTSVAVAALRLPEFGGAAEAERAALDGIYAFFLDIALLTLITALRQAARSVDAAQQAALGRYAEARRNEAIERERVQIDALVHDRVLTTFITAARADSAGEQRLLTGMAEDAIRQLTGGAPVLGVGHRPIGLDEVVSWLRRDGAAVVGAFEVLSFGSPDARVPAAAAEALVSAAVQAMVNSVNHAGGPDVRRSVEVRMVDGGLTIVVADDGRGFAMADIAAERLGVRVSILERARAAGGVARIRSAPGQGARIELPWRQSAPAPEHAPRGEREAVPS